MKERIMQIAFFWALALLCIEVFKWPTENVVLAYVIVLLARD